MSPEHFNFGDYPKSIPTSIPVNALNLASKLQGAQGVLPSEHIFPSGKGLYSRDKVRLFVCLQCILPDIFVLVLQYDASKNKVKSAFSKGISNVSIQNIDSQTG